jgi:hypothetical protein
MAWKEEPLFGSMPSLNLESQIFLTTETPRHIVMPRAVCSPNYIVDGGVWSDRRILITISTDLAGIHPKPVVYCSSI